MEIGGTKLQIVSGDAQGHIVDRWRCQVDPSKGGQGIREQIGAVLGKALQQMAPPQAMGVGFGGPVDWQTGRIACSHQIEGWSGFDLAGWVRQITGLQNVFVENDANVATLGEAVLGAGHGHDPVFYVTLGSGVGGGLVAGLHIYHGAKPGEAEIGHLRLDRNGATVESRCSGWAVDRRIRAAKASSPKGLLSRLTANVASGEARFLAQACEGGDAEAQKILRETAEDLALGLSHVVHLFHPEVIVIGGGLSLMGEPLRAAIEQTLPGFVMDVFKPGPQIRLAALGEDAVTSGALLLAQAHLVGRQKPL
jgi:glucokinase